MKNKIVLRFIKADYAVPHDDFNPPDVWSPSFVKVFGGSLSRFRKRKSN